MELLLILTYTAICVAVFKIFRIPVNKWTLPTAALGGIFMIGLILLVMNYKTLQDMGASLPGGRAVALIDLDEDTSAYNIPGGAAAQVAAYTPYAHHFAIIRKILLRMRSGENFVFLEGHGGGGSDGGGGHWLRRYVYRDMLTSSSHVAMWLVSYDEMGSIGV